VSSKNAPARTELDALSFFHTSLVAAMPLTLTGIMQLVTSRDASAFKLELPDGHRTKSIDGVRPMKKSKYDLLPR